MSNESDRSSNPKRKANIFRNRQHRAVIDVEKPCKIKEICQTCAYINTSYKSSLEKKWRQGIKLFEEAGVLRKAKAIPPKLSEKPLGYRNHAKLAVRDSRLALNKDPVNRFAVGLYVPGSHDVIDISDCPLHRETINRMVFDLKPLLHQSSLKPYDEINQEGDLRYLAIRSSHLTDELMLTFVMNSDSHRRELKSMVAELVNQKKHQIQAAYVNINKENTNVIFGPDSRHLSGANRLRESLCGFNFEIGPTSFFQVNPTEAERIYRRIEQLSGSSLIQNVAWDLYCGVGQISLVLARNGYRVLGMEMNPQSIRDAQKNASVQIEGTIPTFVTGRIEDEVDSFPAWAQQPSLIVANPARKGMEHKVREHLKKVLSENPDCEFIYVSCEGKSLCRDLKEICVDGRRLRQLEAFDMFPFTDKLEWLAVVK